VDTLAIYDQTPQFLRQLDVNREEIVKGIIGTIGTMDAYQLPDAKGFTSMARYLTGDTDEVRQQLRDEVLSTTIDDFRHFADALDTISEKGLVVVLGSQSAMDAAEMDDLRTFKLM
jgi:Zn-dependent M16 (insulinase) family peptidase